MLIELVDRAKWKKGDQKSLAKELGLSEKQLSQIKTGKLKPNNFVVMQLAEIAGLNPVETLFDVMESIDKEHADQYRKWRPYGDSNPGYRRERAMS